MNNSLTPEKILDNVINNNISFNEAIELLISIIEVSENDNIRAKSIDAFSKIDVKNNKIFKILENHLLSDESPSVRAAAAKVLISKFPKDSIDPLKWTIQRDNSAIVLKTIAYSLENEDNQIFKNLKKERRQYNFLEIVRFCTFFPLRCARNLRISRRSIFCTSLSCKKSWNCLRSIR